MKVIILVRILWASGAQKIAIEEARWLSRLGYNVKLVFLREAESGKYLEPLMNGLDYEVFSSKTTPKWIYSTITGMFMPDRKGEGALDYNLLKSFASQIKIKDADYIICHDQWAGIAGLIAHNRQKVPYSVYCHEKISGKYEVPILGRLAKRKEREVLINAKRVFGVTIKVAESVEESYRIKAIPNLPGMNLKESKRFKEKKNIILASATWDENRDPSNYLNVIKELEGFSLYLVGRWRTSQLYHNFMDHLTGKQMTDRVFVIPEILEQDLQNLYAEAKYSLRFGKQEWGLGTSNIESISHLTPIIVNSELGMSEIITRNGGGLVVDSLDVNNITSFIIEHNDEARYEKLQEELRNITREYTWERHSQSLMT